MEPVDKPVPASSTPLGDVDPRADALYAGDAGALRPVHDAVVMLAEGLGDDAHRETGVPAVPRFAQVEARWVPGPTVTARAGR